MDASIRQTWKVMAYAGLFFTMPYFVYLFLKSVTRVPDPPPTSSQPQLTLEQPEPEQPEPEQPDPEQLEPEQPEPEKPEPQQLQPEQSEPEQPQPEQQQSASIESQPTPKPPRPTTTENREYNSFNIIIKIPYFIHNRKQLIIIIAHNN